MSAAPCVVMLAVKQSQPAVKHNSPELPPEKSAPWAVEPQTPVVSEVQNPAASDPQNPGVSTLKTPGVELQTLGAESQTPVFLEASNPDLSTIVHVHMQTVARTRHSWPT